MGRPRPRVPELGEFFSQHIKPDDRVACVGAYFSPRDDPSPFYASVITSQGKGTVHIIDSQAGNLLDLLKAASNRHSGIAAAKLRERYEHFQGLSHHGSGDVLFYRNSAIELAQEKGLKIRPPAIRVADATDTRFDDKKFHVLIDAGTLRFLLGLTGEVKKTDWERVDKKKLFQVLNEYDRISQKIVFLYPQNGGQGAFVRKALQSLGAKVTLQTVKNRYSIPIPNTSDTLQLKHGHHYDQAMVAEF